MMQNGQVSLRIGGLRLVFFVDADVKTGLLELFFNIHLSFLYQREKVAA